MGRFLMPSTRAFSTFSLGIEILPPLTSRCQLFLKFDLVCYADSRIFTVAPFDFSPSLVSSTLILFSFCISNVLSLCRAVSSSYCFAWIDWSSILIAFVSSSFFRANSYASLRASSSFFTQPRTFFNSASNCLILFTDSSWDSPNKLANFCFSISQGLD